jgi:hypothetical protein
MNVDLTMKINVFPTCLAVFPAQSACISHPDLHTHFSILTKMICTPLTKPNVNRNILVEVVPHHE